MNIAGGVQVDCLTHAGESYISTLGLILIGTEGLIVVTSGHAVGDSDADHDGPIVLPNGTTIGKVSYNAYMKGAMGSEEGYPGPDVALAEYQGPAAFARPYLIALGGSSASFPVTGSKPLAPVLPIQVFSFVGQVAGIVEEIDAEVVDAVTRLKVSNVAVASYTFSGNKSAAGAPVVTLDPETGFKIVGFHGGGVYDPSKDSDRSWFVPWDRAQKALGLPVF